MVQVVQPLRSVQSPSFILPRVAGEEPEVGVERFEPFEHFEQSAAYRGGIGPGPANFL
jgi:hypothetical protein